MTKKIGKNSSEEIFCAGFGGQGVMFLGKLIVEAALLGGKFVTWMPSYGAEVRGGTAYSMAKLSNAQIASPVVTNPTIFIAMNRPSLLKYQDRLREGALLIANSTFTGKVPKRKGAAVVNVPMTELASKLGDTRVANMIGLGAMLKRTKFVVFRNVVAALKSALSGKEDLFQLNKKALEKGYRI